MAESQLQVTEAKNILKAFQDKVRHLQEQLRAGLNENSHLQQSLTVSISGEVEGWSHRTQGLKGPKKMGLGSSSAKCGSCWMMEGAS